MQTIKNVIQLHDLSTRSGIAARQEPHTSCQTATSSTSVDTETQKKRIDRLFLRFAAMYGHVWRSLYKSDDFLAFTKSEWLKGLKKFGDSIFESALQYSLKHWEYPPTLPQFTECCRAYSKQGQYDKPCTIYKPSSPEVAHAHLSKIKTILNQSVR